VSFLERLMTSRVRARLLTHFFTHPDEPYYLKELVRLLGENNREGQSLDQRHICDHRPCRYLPLTTYIVKSNGCTVELQRGPPLVDFPRASRISPLHSIALPRTLNSPPPRPLFCRKACVFFFAARSRWSRTVQPLERATFARYRPLVPFSPDAEQCRV